MKRTPKSDEKVNLLKPRQRRILPQNLRNRTHPRNARIALKLNLHRKLSRQNMTTDLIRNSSKIVYMLRFLS